MDAASASTLQPFGARVARAAGRQVAWNVILPSTMEHREAEAINAVLHGDIERYAELVDRYQAPALRLAFSFLRNYEDAKDVSQEAFVSAYQSLNRFHGRAKFSTWLYRIIVNKCKDVHRQRVRQPFVVARVGEPDANAPEDGTLFVDVGDPHAGPSDALVNRELSQRLSEAIRLLPAHQQAAFLLHHVHGLPLDDVAAVMRCRPGTIKSHVFRAVHALRRQLGPQREEGYP